MEPLSSVYERLMRQSIEAGRSGNRISQERAKLAGTSKAANGQASTTQGVREGEPSAALAFGWEGQPMGISGKGRGPKPAPVHRGERQNGPEGKRVGFDYVVHTNHAASTMQARKTAERRTSAAFLTCIQGGKR